MSFRFLHSLPFTRNLVRKQRRMRQSRILLRKMHHHRKIPLSCFTPLAVQDFLSMFRSHTICSGSGVSCVSVHFSFQSRPSRGTDCPQAFFTDEGVPVETRVASMASPPFHLLGVVPQVFRPILSGRVALIYPPVEPAPPMFPTGDNLLDHCRRTQANSMLIVPFLLETWVNSPEATDYLKTMVYVVSATSMTVLIRLRDSTLDLRRRSVESG